MRGVSIVELLWRSWGVNRILPNEICNIARTSQRVHLCCRFAQLAITRVLEHQPSIANCIMFKASVDPAITFPSVAQVLPSANFRAVWYKRKTRYLIETAGFYLVAGAGCHLYRTIIRPCQ
jgi:hypothetical protein